VELPELGVSFPDDSEGTFFQNWNPMAVLGLVHSAAGRRAGRQPPGSLRADLATGRSHVMYESPLIMFRSYALSPVFGAYLPTGTTGDTASLRVEVLQRRIDSHRPLCRFAVHGRCNDAGCGFQHLSGDGSQDVSVDHFSDVDTLIDVFRFVDFHFFSRKLFESFWKCLKRGGRLQSIVMTIVEKIRPRIFLRTVSRKAPAPLSWRNEGGGENQLQSTRSDRGRRRAVTAEKPSTPGMAGEVTFDELLESGFMPLRKSYVPEGDGNAEEERDEDWTSDEEYIEEDGSRYFVWHGSLEEAQVMTEALEILGADMSQDGTPLTCLSWHLQKGSHAMPDKSDGEGLDLELNALRVLAKGVEQYPNCEVLWEFYLVLLVHVEDRVPAPLVDKVLRRALRSFRSSPSFWTIFFQSRCFGDLVGTLNQEQRESALRSAPNQAFSLCSSGRAVPSRGGTGGPHRHLSLSVLRNPDQQQGVEWCEQRAFLFWVTHCRAVSLTGTTNLHETLEVYLMAHAFLFVSSSSDRSVVQFCSNCGVSDDELHQLLLHLLHTRVQGVPAPTPLLANVHAGHSVPAGSSELRAFSDWCAGLVLGNRTEDAPDGGERVWTPAQWVVLRSVILLHLRWGMGGASVSMCEEVLTRSSSETGKVVAEDIICTYAYVLGQAINSGDVELSLSTLRAHTPGLQATSLSHAIANLHFVTSLLAHAPAGLSGSFWYSPERVEWESVFQSEQFGLGVEALVRCGEALLPATAGDRCDDLLPPGVPTQGYATGKDSGSRMVWSAAALVSWLCGPGPKRMFAAQAFSDPVIATVLRPVIGADGWKSGLARDPGHPPNAGAYFCVTNLLRLLDIRMGLPSDATIWAILLEAVTSPLLDYQERVVLWRELLYVHEIDKPRSASRAVVLLDLFHTAFPAPKSFRTPLVSCDRSRVDDPWYFLAGETAASLIGSLPKGRRADAMRRKWCKLCKFHPFVIAHLRERTPSILQQQESYWPNEV